MDESSQLDELRSVTPLKLLTASASTIAERSNSRDLVGGTERSMAATVTAFNALFGTTLTETQGWLFMTLLKTARASKGVLRLDDYVDGAAYYALAGESAIKEFLRDLDARSEVPEVTPQQTTPDSATPARYTTNQ